MEWLSAIAGKFIALMELESTLAHGAEKPVIMGPPVKVAGSISEGGAGERCI
jgi:hypothetical protein